MIELQTALFIAGLIAFGVVAIMSYDKYRRARERTNGDVSEPKLGESREPVLSDGTFEETTDESGIRSRTEPQLGPKYEPIVDENSSATEQEPGVESASQYQSSPTLKPPLEQHTYHPTENVFEDDIDVDQSTPVDQVFDSNEERVSAIESEPVELESTEEAKLDLDSNDPEQQYPRDPMPETGSLDDVLQEAERVAHRPVAAVESFDDAVGGHAEDEFPIELVARIPGTNIIKRDTALGIYRQYEFELKKRHKIYGLLHPAKMWCDLERQPESSGFTDFGVTLQLADRDGPVSESEINRFSQMVLRFAEIFGRRFRFSAPFEDALKHAEMLDDLCRKYDSVAILNVVARNENFRGSEIDRHAREMDLKLNTRYVYQKRNPKRAGGEGLYALANMRDDGTFKPPASGELVTDGVTLFENIPCTKDPAEVFNEMVADAKEMCKRLDGKLVDQNQRGMTQKGLKSISQNIRQLAADMERDGLMPGGDKAQRLF